jgi:oligoribonuclease NrnB/cAMP/cGMP phosphodiesterase (DHH superfamily)
MKYNYIIFHKGCLDGFTGFFILTTTNSIDLNEKPYIYPDQPSTNSVPPHIENKDVIIIDTAYKYPILREIVILAKSVTFIDHHVTIRDDVLKINKEFFDKKKITIVYDVNKSAASLVWQYFYPSKKTPLFVKYVEDNDTGTWKMKYTNYFINAINVKYNFTLSFDNFKKWNNLFEKKQVKKLIKKGIIYSEYINNLLENNSKKYSMMAFPSSKIYSENSNLFSKPGEYNVAVFCGACPSATQISTYVLDKIDCDFVMVWIFNMDRKEFIISFRSQKVDVGSIAQIFGGGGHKFASACSFSSKQYYIDDLFLEKSLPRKSK